MADRGSEGKTKLRSTKPDFATIGGIVIALAGIVGGLVIEGGKVSDITQVTAAMIVLGGTLGAVMVTTPLSALLGAFKGIKNVFLDEHINPQLAIEEIIRYATKARKSSIISLEEDLDKIED